jgi:hypothetical protein
MIKFSSTFKNYTVYTFHQLLGRFGHTAVDFGLFRVPDLESELSRAVVTDQQGTLAPSRHLIPSLLYPEVCVRWFTIYNVHVLCVFLSNIPFVDTAWIICLGTDPHYR